MKTGKSLVKLATKAKRTAKTDFEAAPIKIDKGCFAQFGKGNLCACGMKIAADCDCPL